MISDAPISDVSVAYLAVVVGTPVWVYALSDTPYVMATSGFYGVEALQSTIYVQAGA